MRFFYSPVCATHAKRLGTAILRGRVQIVTVFTFFCHGVRLSPRGTAATV
jgi:hypothetical protein